MSLLLSGPVFFPICYCSLWWIVRACELCSSVLHLPVHVQSGSAATRVRQRSQRNVQGVRLRSHDADVLVYDSWHENIFFNL